MNYVDFVQNEDMAQIGLLQNNLKEHNNLYEPFKFDANEYESWIKLHIELNMNLMQKFHASMNAKKAKNALDNAQRDIS